MSRAFTKEIDDAPEPTLERAVSSAPNFVTRRGAQLIEEQLRTIDQQLEDVTDPGKIERLRRDRRYWDARRASMQVVVPESDPIEVSFGRTVEIKRAGRTVRLTIVGEDEADPAAGLVAWTAPLAIALDGAVVDDVIEFGSQTIKVLGIEA